VHYEFGTTDNISNQSINSLLHKIRYDVPVPEKPAMSMTDWCPIRMDRQEMVRTDPVVLAKKAKGLWKNSHIPIPLKMVPQDVREYWTQRTWLFVRRSTASVIVLFGSHSHERYLQCLKGSGIPHELLLDTPAMKSKRVAYYGILEKTLTG
jgi:hypothetical protein